MSYPAHLLFPPLLEEINASGVKIPHVKLLIAVGTYRPMTAEEIICKIGQEVAQKYVIMNHEWDNPEALHDYGHLEDGTKIILNKQMALVDFVIGVGSIAPHTAAGFSGGGKIVAPGVACKSICRSLCKEV
jgi:nickel-dependent lactate racemase